MEEKVIICVTCPRGCHITVRGQGEHIESISGEGCKRGLAYAQSEFVCPKRLLTTLVRLNNAPVGRAMLPVRSTEPIERSLIAQCVAEIKRQQVTAPVALHQPIVKNILNTGVDIVASMPVKEGERHV